MPVMEITDAAFEAEVIQSESPVLVDFWAVWCGPCRMIAPVVEELSKEYAGKMKFCKVNIDDNQDTAAQLGIRSIPTLLLFKNGEVAAQVVGAVGKDVLKGKIDEVLK
ncbi:thioredoxin [bacterium]|nr:thioredoxin [bacterium]